MHDLENQRIRYSQSSIKPYLSDGRTSLESGMDSLPLEVMNIDGEAYISLNNRRAIKYSPNQLVKCIVYNAQDPVSSKMQDHGLDLATVIYFSGNELYRLSLRAKTIEAVIIIRCASQNSDFPLDGKGATPIVSYQRIYDNAIMKLTPASAQFIALPVGDYADSLRTSSEMYIRPVSDINIYHQRNDFRQLILDHPLLFDVMRYERCTEGWSLVARGEKDPVVWDDWDGLLATASEAEGEREDSYLMEN